MTPPLAFWNFVSLLSLPVEGNGLPDTLSSMDHWIVAKIGIHLMLECAKHQDWYGGFQVLYCLHTYGIHYVVQQQTLLQIMAVSCQTSQCSTVLTAVNICLMLQNPTGAIQVFSDCNWVKASDFLESCQRTEALVTLMDQCIDADMLECAVRCFEELVNSEPLPTYKQKITTVGAKLVDKCVRMEMRESARKVSHMVSSFITAMQACT